MAEPHSTAAAGFLGVKYSSLIFGFLGSVLYLMHTPELPKRKYIIALFSGIVCGSALPSLANSYLGFPDVVENGMALIIGLVAMKLIAGILHAADRFSEDPLSVMGKGGDQK